VNVRRLGPGDEGAAEAAYGRFGPRERIDAPSFLRRDEVRFFVAEDESNVVGWLYGYELTHPDGARSLLMYALGVAEEARGKGVAGSLVDACVSEARDSGCVEAWVMTPQSNPAGMATYGRAGGQADPDPQVVFKWDFPRA
jgi:ribosomal protein S18 acetylase RimI-like enzyme